MGDSRKGLYSFRRSVAAGYHEPLGVRNKMFRNLALYIKVKTNSFEIRNIQAGTNVSVISKEPFTTERLLVGQFCIAEKELKKGIKNIIGNSFLLSKFNAIIQPIDKTEGGLSEVEERVLLEVATGAGARTVSVWVGHELSDQEVIEKLKNA